MSRRRRPHIGTVIDRLLAGEIVDDPETAVDDAIDEWHESEEKVELAEWLGMSKVEYAYFFEDPEHLRTILHARAFGLDITDIAGSNFDESSLAARGLALEEFEKVRQWLMKTGRM